MLSSPVPALTVLSLICCLATITSPVESKVPHEETSGKINEHEGFIGDHGSGEFEPTTTTAFPGHHRETGRVPEEGHKHVAAGEDREAERVEDTPNIIVVDHSDKPCLLATINATMVVSYAVPIVVVDEAYLAVSEVHFPQDAVSHGLCGRNTSLLTLDWGGNDTFSVTLNFTRDGEAKSKDSPDGTWSVTGMSITYDLSNKDVFPGASGAGRRTAEDQSLDLFTTDVGHSYGCDRDTKALIGDMVKGVQVTFHHMQLAAFGVKSASFPEVQYCADPAYVRHDEILVPLIIACSLSAIVILVVIGYVLSRKLQKRKYSSAYTPMP